ncbi:MAG: TetR/AcrR family transcriptional regulator, partial [Acidimicrobiales bacterium]
MSTIAKDAGYTPTALRHHFPNKVELYSAVFAATANEVYPQIVQHLYSPSMAQAIEGSMANMHRISNDSPEYTYFLARVPSELRKFPELRDRVEVRENFTEFFYSSLIALGRKTGELESLTDELHIKFFRIAMQGWIYEGHYSQNVNLTTQTALLKLLQRL